MELKREKETQSGRNGVAIATKNQTNAAKN